MTTSLMVRRIFWFSVLHIYSEFFDPVKEFKALMYSVGEELNKVQTAELFAKFAQDDRITRPSYLEVQFR
jgi:hypothetical protein